MPALSTFQQLPLHIAEAIIGYYVPSFQTYSGKEWPVLYEISCVWRILALNTFYRKASIIAAAKMEEGKFEFPYKPKQIKIHDGFLGLIKEVEVIFDYEYQNLDGKQPNDFSSTWPESLVFPKARSLKIDVTGFLNHYRTINDTTATTRFMWLAQRIRTAIPNLQNVTIVDYRSREDFGQESPSRSQWNADNLLPAIFERATSVYLGAWPICPENIHSSVYSCCSKLVHLEFECTNNVELFHHLARGSAASLETLRVRYYPFKTMKSLVVDGEDQPVVFPRLQKLYFESFISHDSTKETVKISKAVAIFPALRHLTWLSEYTLEDGILFRGNNDKLEYLCISFSDDLANILERHDVFSFSRYPRLCCVKTHISCSMSDEKHCLNHLARLLSPVTQVLSISGTCSYQEINNSVFKVASLQNIQVLIIIRINISFFEILGLLKRMPNLASLDYSSTSIYPELQHGVSRRKEFVEDAYKEYYPLNSRLRVWMHSAGTSESMALLALASVVLAVLCPSFCYTRIRSHSLRETYQHKLKDTIASISNNQNAEKLEYLYRRSLEYFD